MQEFKRIDDIGEYVSDLLESGLVKAKLYTKFVQIHARQGQVGEVLLTVMKDGLVETKNVVKIDEKTGQPDWIVQNPSGEEYIIKDSALKDKYDYVGDDVFKPKLCINKFIEIKDDIKFYAPWGEEMNIAKGGYLNITKKDDIYGVQRAEFLETYAECDEYGNFKKQTKHCEPELSR